jgi:predicted RNA-binding Zn-ribbon protein involved in translation (DUF1610 family)
MSPLFAPPPRDRLHLIETLETLGPTSIHGLSAALSWSPRRTENAVREVVRRAEAPILFDRITGIVRLRAPPVAPAPAVPASPPPTPPSISGGRTSDSPASLTRVRNPLGQHVPCPTCRVPLESTGTGDSAYCPKCGRLTRTAAASSTPSSPLADASSSSPPPNGMATPPADRRSQELFAAWVTQSPIPCPKCRTPLKHRSFAEYSCPRCGQRVSFSGHGVTPLDANATGTGSGPSS